MRGSVVVASLSVILLTLVFLTSRVQSSPTKYSYWKEYVEAMGKQISYTGTGSKNKCTHGGPIRNLCERCAKFTKNEVVFPLCCEDQEDVRSWCKDFLEYTPDLHSN